MSKAKAGDCEDNYKSSHQCKECNFIGKTLSILRAHVTVKHTEREKKPFVCNFPNCDFRTTTYGNLWWHRRKCHPESADKHKVHACDQCEYKTYKRYKLREHAATHSDERPYVGEFSSCSFQTKTQRQLEMHKKLHDPDQDKFKAYSCNLCGHRCRTNQNLVNHMRTHTGDKPYACDFPGCNYRSTMTCSLRTHRRRHDPDSMLKCDFPGCEYGAANSWLLQQHQVTHNPERKRNLQCPLCSKTFALKIHLVSHIKGFHTRENRIPCKFCDLNFSSAAAVRMHTIKSHVAKAFGMDTIVRKYKCTDCDYSNTVKLEVLDHQRRRHSAIKNFKCDHCDYRAKCMYSVRRHKKYCPGLSQVKPFECQLCPKKFPIKLALRRHLENIHRPVKKHKCERCGFTTNYTATIRLHLKNHCVEENDKGKPRASKLKPVEIKKSGVTRLQLEAARDDKAELTYKCEFPDCNYVTHRHQNLKRHEIHHRPELQNIQCPLCPRRFFFQSAFNTHIKFSHTKEKPFKCGECDYQGSTAAITKEHQERVHEKDKGSRSKASDRVRETEPEKHTPRKEFGVKQFYSCPFCDSTHDQYIAIVRHTVIHRVAMVALERKHFVCQ